MCGVCGCGKDETRIEAGDGRKPQGDHHHHHAHIHDQITIMGTAITMRITIIITSTIMTTSKAMTTANPASSRSSRNLLAKNDAYAADNRIAFNMAGVLALNLVSSPGSGKTSLLVETIKRLQSDLPVAVIEGDQQTSMDAERIRATGAPALQINTGKGCHLDAHMTGHAFEQLRPAFGSVLFIENVGNLVCPAMFDLGEEHRVVLLSVTEGEDKPLKYPDMIRSSHLLLITKVDLLPHLDLDMDALVSNARKINPGIKILKVSAKTDEGMDGWTGFIRAARRLALTGCATAEEWG